MRDWAIGLLAAMAMSPAKADTPRAGPTLTLYENVRLVLGPAGPTDILVEGETIRAVRPHGSIANAELNGAEIVDAQGLYALPGLIDAHVHLAGGPDRVSAEGTLARNLYSGVTAVRDMGGDARNLADLSRAALVGEIAAPDIYFSAFFAGPDFFKDPRAAASTQGMKAGATPWMRAIIPQTDLRQAVAEARGASATGIKIYADLSPFLVKAIAREAHRQHLQVWAHAAVFPASPSDVIDADVDVISHACLLAYQRSDAMPARYHDRPAVDGARIAEPVDPVLAKLFSRMRAHGQALDATLRVYREWDDAYGAKPNPPGFYCSLSLAGRIARQAHSAGVPIVAGTDGDSADNDPYPALFEELQLLHLRAGLTNAEVLAAATHTNARILGAPGQSGNIVEGGLADFGLFRANPAEELANLRTIAVTVKRGRAYPRTKFDALWAAWRAGGKP